MTQPIQPQPYGQQPPPPRPQADPDLPNPGRWEKRQRKQKRFGWVALVVTALVSLTLGGLVGGANDGTTTTAQPAPTATTTVTETADPPVGEGEGTEAPTVEPEPEPTEAPAAWNPKPKDFKVTVKITDKQCFDTAGCLIDYKIALDYLGSQKLPSEGTTDVTYQISGAKDLIIGTVTLDSEGKFDLSEESTDTSSSSKKLVAKVTEVDYNEFG